MPVLTLTCESTPEAGIPATDIGYLLYKNPGSTFEKKLSFGTVRVLYPEATVERCTVALLLEVDSVGLVRNNRGATLAQYVSDRPYVPSSFLSVAIAEAFGTALSGNSRERPELINIPLTLSARLVALDCDAGETLIGSLFEPLGYTVTVSRHGKLDARFPEWGESDLYDICLTGSVTVRDLLTHLYVLIPVLDNAKHYFIGQDEVEKLVRRGEGWLQSHPQKELITRRYLRYRRELTAEALSRLADVEGVPEEEEETQRSRSASEETLEAPVRLNDQRIEAAIEAIRALDPPARRVIDLGCGEGRTLAAIRNSLPSLELLAGMDVSTVALSIVARRLRLDPTLHTEKLTLFQGSLVYRDSRLFGFDVALLMEVIEHLDPDRLRSLEQSVFATARPRRIVVTTPNAEYNSVWKALPAGKFRHPDHRFEWTRTEFQGWAKTLGERHDYQVTFTGIGNEDPEGRGTPTQMAVFDRNTG
ncbi:MAG: 3' terminal RNA ribose 2'-O-methyltransferase Hen1 [Armatimonadaceae bacterium]